MINETTMSSSKLFHVAIVDDWEASKAWGTYEASTRGRSFADDGFIHVATFEQIPAALANYADLTFPLFLLVLDEANLLDAGVPVEWVTEDTNLSKPRLMAPVPTDDPLIVLDVIPLVRADGRWVPPPLHQP